MCIAMDFQDLFISGYFRNERFHSLIMRLRMRKFYTAFGMYTSFWCISLLKGPWHGSVLRMCDFEPNIINNLESETATNNKKKIIILYGLCYIFCIIFLYSLFTYDLKKLLFNVLLNCVNMKKIICAFDT